MSERLNIRARFLWIPGILIIATGIYLPIRKARILRYEKYIAKRAVVCNLNIDLRKEGIAKTSFVSIVTRTFILSFNLHTAIPDCNEVSSAQDVFSSNPIEEALETETIELSWRLLEKNQTVATGIITEKDIKKKFGTLDIRYRFAPEYVFLRKGQQYTLVVEVGKPSPALDVFYPELIIRTWSSLKGYRLVGWKMRDTLKCLALGTVLIAAGLVKRCAS